MIKTIRKSNITFISLLLVIICGFVYCATNFLQAKQTINETQVVVRTVEINKNAVDYQSILDEFEDSTLETQGSLTTFEGYKSINFAELDGFDLVSSDNIKDTEAKVKYNFSYDKETNIVTLSAELKDELGEIQIDTLKGTAFINNDGEIDAVMNVDGESILLSEMKNAGMIDNCGWFSRLIKKVVKVVAVAVVVASVAVATAAVVVATAGAAAPALVAAGVGVTTASTVGAGVGLVAGALYASTIGMAALQAGTAFAEVVAEGVEAIVERSGRLLEITYKCKKYAAELLTATVIETLAKDAYFIALADTSSGAMYYTPIAIPKSTAISVVHFNSLVSIYTVLPSNARSVAQQAGNNMSPVFDLHHGVGYFDHYHRGDISHDLAKSHVFFGLPQYF